MWCCLGSCILMGFCVMQNSLQMDSNLGTRRGRGPSNLQRIISGMPLNKDATNNV